MALERRQFLIGSAAGGGLLLGWWLLPRRHAPPLEAGENEYAFDAWLKIGKDGVVTVAVPELEMGQGVTTILPQVVAMELGADWRQVAVEPAAISAAYANAPLAARWAELWMPVLPGLAADPDGTLARRFAESARFMVAADGTTLAAHEGPARAAAASARAMLCMAAADRWGVDWEACEADGGFVSHGRQRLSFAALVEDAADFDPPLPPPLRAAPPAERPGENPPGAPLRYPRLDLPAKVDGSYQFAGDVRLPDMLFAAIRHGPVGEATLAAFDAAKAKGAPGLAGLVKGKRWLAAVATNWWAAEQALALIVPGFTTRGKADSARIAAALAEGLDKGEASRLHAAGDADAALAGRGTLALRYDVAPALHATLETASCTARLVDGRLELWLATQAPEAARRAAAEAIGLDVKDVVLYPMPAGGSFDRRLEHDHAIEAAVIAQQTGRPVQLVWSRWQEHLAGWPRTPVAARMSARTTPTGEILGWKARLALPASAHEFGHRLLGGLAHWSAIERAAGDADRLATEGALPAYAIADIAIDHVPVRIDLPTARMRGNAHGYTAFFTECFIDELAHIAHREPMSYRIAMLGHDLRLAQCLQRAATLATWNGGADASGQGIACHRIGEGRIAAVVTARRDETGVRVDKISAVADIGRIINVDIARQQIEGGLLFGLGLAMGCTTAYANGIPATGRLAGLNLPLLADCPEIEVDFVESEADPADPGELGVAVIAPAVANALFSATGIRFRKLPLSE